MKNRYLKRTDNPSCLFFSLCFIFIFSLLFSTPNLNDPSIHPSIIYLQGTCSSGKSTLIQHILHRWEDLVIVDEDVIMHQSYVDAVAQRFPIKFLAVIKAIAPENLYHALREKEILFKKPTSDQERTQALMAVQEIQEELNKSENLSWKQEVSQGISAEVIKRIQEAIKKNKHVLLDSWYMKPDQLHSLYPNTPVIRVLLYCPLQVAYNRFLKRNRDALIQEDLQEKRYLRQLVGTFFSLYQIQTQPQKPIQKIRKDELTPVIDIISLSLKDGSSVYQKPIFTLEEISRPLFLKMASEFLQPFDDRESEVFYIAPKKEQDIIIDNSSGDLQDSVQAIEEILKKTSRNSYTPHV
jgi:deoxyadenosine/deoxycytidine kinase